MLRIPRTSIRPRITALVVLALVRARRGDPGHRPLLDEAWSLAEPTGELISLGPVAAARAEAAWLGADRDGVASATELALPLASERWPALADELAVWRGRGRPRYRRTLAARRHIRPATGREMRTTASALWAEAGCGYEAALALCDAEDEAALRRALEDLQRLEARPAVAIVTRRLRERGVISLPGANFTTRQNQYGLTGRELEVLALVNKGFQNSQIADHLFVSVRTVDHHIEAILRKLGARTRADRAGKGECAGYRRAHAAEGRRKVTGWGLATGRAVWLATGPFRPNDVGPDPVVECWVADGLRPG